MIDLEIISNSDITLNRSFFLLPCAVGQSLFRKVQFRVTFEGVPDFFTHCREDASVASTMFSFTPRRLSNFLVRNANIAPFLTTSVVIKRKFSTPDAFSVLEVHFLSLIPFVVVDHIVSSHNLTVFSLTIAPTLYWSACRVG